MSVLKPKCALLLVFVAACAGTGALANTGCKSLEEDLTERGLTYFLEGLRILAERKLQGIEPVVQMIQYSGRAANGRLGVLVPTNDAFIAAQTEIQNTTASFLLHVYYTHMITTDAPLDTLVKEGNATAVNTVPLAVGEGEKDAVTFKAEGGDMTATVTTADISTCAAQLQIVDTVLIVPELNSPPAAAAPAPAPTAALPPSGPSPEQSSPEPEDASQKPSPEPESEKDGANITEEDENDKEKNEKKKKDKEKKKNDEKKKRDEKKKKDQEEEEEEEKKNDDKKKDSKSLK